MASGIIGMGIGMGDVAATKPRTRHSSFHPQEKIYAFILAANHPMPPRTPRCCSPRLRSPA
jgi:hypothetical protein